VLVRVNVDKVGKSVRVGDKVEMPVKIQQDLEQKVIEDVITDKIKRLKAPETTEAYVEAVKALKLADLAEQEPEAKQADLLAGDK